MTESEKSTYRCTRVPLSILLLLAIAGAAWPRTAPDFSGQWMQDTNPIAPNTSAKMTKT